MDAYGNRQLNAAPNVAASADNADVKIDVEDHRDGTVTVTLLSFKAAKNLVDVTVEGESIRGSPFEAITI